MAKKKYTSTLASCTPTLLESKPELMIALYPNPSMEGGRLVLTPQCAYSPQCAPTSQAIVVTFVDYKSEGADYRLEHRNYCCELHAAFDLLRVFSETGDNNEAILEMVRRSLDGEPILGDRVPQAEIDVQVEDILQGSGGGAA